MKRGIPLIFVIFLISSCAYVISSPLREQARADISFTDIKKNIDKYRGTIFILGGVIVATRNTDEGTIIEAIQTPVDRYGSIIDPDVSYGRFMAIQKGYLDPLIYKKKRGITIAGELSSTTKKKIGEVEYIYPIFEIKEIYLWKDERHYIPPPYPSPMYWHRYPYWWYDYWWYEPYY